jgi:hypothetical protein
MAKKAKGSPLYRGGTMAEGTPELCRGATKSAKGTPELSKAGSPPNSPELWRGGSADATMRELGDFKARPFVDRTAQLEAACCDTFNNDKGGTSDSALTPGHKVMAGMT